MKISPCGWFCFDEPVGWSSSDTPESILLHHQATDGVIEITSARKESPVRETDAWNLLEESMAAMPGSDWEETAMFRLPSGVECLKSIQTMGGLVRGLAFVFWNQYCVQMKIQAKTDINKTQECVSGMNILLESFQPLTLD
ncbi:MAG TPA: hypothetical protein VLM37_09685 [Fibrobacteraceae bacterium]|nr:hypothetical protein [Fibrobacteraceae bacterium]